MRVLSHHAAKLRLRRGFFAVALLAAALGGEGVGRSQAAKVAGNDAAAAVTAGKTSAADAKNVLTEAMTRRALRVLQRYLPSNEFHLTLSATPKAPFLADVPYMPASQTADMLVRMTPEELAPLVEDLKVTVSLSKRFDAATRKSIGDLLKEELGFMREGAITFKDLEIQTAVQDTAAEKQLQRSEADLRQARTEMEQLKRERNDAKNELLLAKTLQDKAAKEPPRVEPPPPVVPEPKVKTAREMAMEVAPFAALAVALILMVLVSSRMFSASIRSVGTGINMIAGALENVGGALKVKTEDDTKPETVAAPLTEVAPVSTASAGTSLSGGDLQQRLLSLGAELDAGLNERTTGMTLKLLTDLLARPESVAKGVATMELLGRDRANALFGRLGKGSRAAVLQFLNNGNYGRPKAELMLEAGEELKTKLLGESFGSMRGELTMKLAEVVLQLTERDIADIVPKLDPSLKPRFFVYLESSILASLLQTLEKRSFDSLEGAIDALSRIADVERDTSRDDKIVAVIEEFLRNKVEDIQAKYVPYYQQIIEALDDSLADRTAERLGESSPSLKTQLAMYVVTFKTFFKLPEPTRKSLVEAFSNRQLSGLLHGTEEALRPAIMECIPERRRSLVTDELEILAGLSPKDGTAAFDQAKALLLVGMKKLRASGQLQELMAAASESGAGPGTGSAAA